MSSVSDLNPKRPLSLLLVDPDSLLLWSLERYLRQWTIVCTATTLEDAQDHLRRAPFDAVILSGNFPAQRLDEMERLAVDRNKNVKIIRLVTDNDDPTSAKSYQRIEKPFKLESIAGMLGIIPRHGH